MTLRLSFLVGLALSAAEGGARTLSSRSSTPSSPSHSTTLFVLRGIGVPCLLYTQWLYTRIVIGMLQVTTTMNTARCPGISLSSLVRSSALSSPASTKSSLARALRSTAVDRKTSISTISEASLSRFLSSVVNGQQRACMVKNPRLMVLATARHRRAHAGHREDKGNNACRH